MTVCLKKLKGSAEMSHDLGQPGIGHGQNAINVLVGTVWLFVSAQTGLGQLIYGRVTELSSSNL